MRIISKWNRRGFLGTAAAVAVPIRGELNSLFSGEKIKLGISGSRQSEHDQQNSCCTNRFHFRHGIRSKLRQRESDCEPLATLSHGNQPDNRDNRSSARRQTIACVSEYQW